MAYAWLQRFVYNPYNWVIILCLLIVVGVVAYMILSIHSRLNEIEERMESRDKAIRVSIMTVEADLENQMQRLNNNVENAVNEINRKRFI
jgi:short subunit fatty acids transporter